MDFGGSSMRKAGDVGEIFINMKGRVVRVIQYGSFDPDAPTIIEDQKTGKTFHATSVGDFSVYSNNEMVVLAYLAEE